MRPDVYTEPLSYHRAHTSPAASPSFGGKRPPAVIPYFVRNLPAVATTTALTVYQMQPGAMGVAAICSFLVGPNHIAEAVCVCVCVCMCVYMWG